MRKQFAKSDIKSFIEAVPFAKDLMTKKSSVVQEGDLLYVDKILISILKDNLWFPSLKILLKEPTLLPHVVVDKGAIKFVVNGADIMRPGITSAQEFAKDDFVCIVDETYSEPLAVGQALFSSSDLLAKDSGKVVKTLHFIGDPYWNV